MKINKKSNYKEFVDQIAKDLSEKLQEIKVTAIQVKKLQGESYYGLCIQLEDSNIGANINLQEAYQNYQIKTSYDEIIQKIADMVKDEIIYPNATVTELADQLEDYDVMRKKLMVQLVPIKGNEEILADIPHKDIEDISLVYRFVFDNNQQGMMSSLVNNQMLKQYDITADQLHEDAIINAAEHFPAKINSIQEVLFNMGSEAIMPITSDAPIFIATCNNAFYGAGCIFYPGFMEQAAEKFNGDFFIIPSSVHEVILLPDNGKMNYRELESIVRQVNRTNVLPKDWLSDSVFHYDKKNKIFEKAERFDERMRKQTKNIYN